MRFNINIISSPLLIEAAGFFAAVRNIPVPMSDEIINLRFNSAFAYVRFFYNVPKQKKRIRS